jgi:hypothetical protein
VVGASRLFSISKFNTNWFEQILQIITRFRGC